MFFYFSLNPTNLPLVLDQWFLVRKHIFRVFFEEEERAAGYCGVLRTLFLTLR